MKRLIFVLSISVFLSSCFTISDGNIGSSSAALNASNFRYVGTVNGQSQAVKFLGLGGVNNGLIRKAVNSLRKDLKSNQALTNITIDKNITVILGGLLINKTIYVSANVVEFDKEETTIKRDVIPKDIKIEKKKIVAE